MKDGNITVAGNFFTDRRIAKYWIDELDKTKDQVSSSLYKDIQLIDTVHSAGLTYCPFMLITKKDNSTSKVYAEGKRQEIKVFFEEAIDKWTQSKNKKRALLQPTKDLQNAGDRTPS